MIIALPVMCHLPDPEIIIPCLVTMVVMIEVMTDQLQALVITARGLPLDLIVLVAIVVEDSITAEAILLAPTAVLIEVDPILVHQEDLTDLIPVLVPEEDLTIAAVAHRDPEVPVDHQVAVHAVAEGNKK